MIHTQPPTKRCYPQPLLRPIRAGLAFAVGWVWLSFCPSAVGQAAPADARSLRLIPFPKEVELLTGRFRLTGELGIQASDSPAVRRAAEDLREELAQIANLKCDLSLLHAPTGHSPWIAWLTSRSRSVDQEWKTPPQPESYELSVSPSCVAVAAGQEAGLVWALQTLRQLVRANLVDGSLPALRIRDWPTLRYRGFSDDITRGSSPKLDTLRREIALNSLLRQNFFTYYLEYQYAFSKHPAIGPKDGSLTPNELRNLVQDAKRYAVEIIGNQQSFGHFYHILKHDQYKNLRESGDVLNPTVEDTYKLLDDLYSEQIPLLEAKFFNVCCDETYDLGKGPCKPVAEKIGVGGLYTMHMRRVHDLIVNKYGKRMMMWGDIIIQHPDRLADIPKDTIMLSWGYSPEPSFEKAILPFSKSGYEFFVCPGVSCWSRILPDFGVAVTNIANYVRDGAKLGALGMLNTTWDDDGENFFAPNWHGVAWGAECAWNGSTTPIEDFNRRIGAVLFGEPGDHFGQAIALLTKTHRLPGFEAMMDGRFWKEEFGKMPVDEKSARKTANALLEITRPALEHLQTAQKQARVNADLLDYFIFGAQRMELMATRALDFLDAARAYEQAVVLTGQPDEAGPLVQRAATILQKVRDEHVRLKTRYAELWLRENKPYALDWTTRKFDALIARYDQILARLQAARTDLPTKRTLPAPAEVGVELSEMGARRTRPAKILTEPLDKDVPWVAETCAKRIGLVLRNGDAARCDQPVEIDLAISADAGRHGKLFELVDEKASQRPVPCQLEKGENGTRLTFVAAGPVPAGGQRRFLLYFDPPGEPTAAPGTPAVRCTDGPNGAKWIENDQIRLLVGPEGGHIYRWEIKALKGLDITEPGEADWAGFADVAGHRNNPNTLEVVSNGPAMVRLRCTDDAGMEKTITAYAGAPWVEITLNNAVGWFWCYDDARVMSADSPTPGTVLFSDGTTEKVRKPSNSTNSQVHKPGVHWGAKFVTGGPLLALITPEVAARHVVGPGGGMGGVGIEGSESVGHFAIYGGPCPKSPTQTLAALRVTLDFRNQPEVEVYAPQVK